MCYLLLRSLQFDMFYDLTLTQHVISNLPQNMIYLLSQQHSILLQHECSSMCALNLGTFDITNTMLQCETTIAVSQTRIKQI